MSKPVKHLQGDRGGQQFDSDQNVVVVINLTGHYLDLLGPNGAYRPPRCWVIPNANFCAQSGCASYCENRRVIQMNEPTNDRSKLSHCLRLTANHKVVTNICPQTIHRCLFGFLFVTGSPAAIVRMKSLQFICFCLIYTVPCQ